MTTIMMQGQFSLKEKNKDLTLFTQLRDGYLGINASKSTDSQVPY